MCPKRLQDLGKLCIYFYGRDLWALAIMTNYDLFTADVTFVQKFLRMIRLLDFSSNKITFYSYDINMI